MQEIAAEARSGTGGATAWRAMLSGLCASLLGIGLARFAYTPLIPTLVAEGWFTPAEAAYLGAANLAGYLAGALLARRLAAKASAVVVLRAMMALAAAAFFACALPLSFSWFSGWRFAAGFSGGVLMVLAAPTVLPHVPPGQRGFAGGVIFTGVGLGIAASGTIVPLLLRASLVETWCGLGALALLLTILAWGGWPEGRAAACAPPAVPRGGTHPSGSGLGALYVEYGLNAVALVPHMIFLVDFVTRGLGQGLQTGARYWVVFGLGAMLGPVVLGSVADRIGFGPALRLAFAVQAAAVALPAAMTGSGWLVGSSILVGAFTPGIVPLVLGRIRELLPNDGPGQQTAWSLATTAFALGQAGAAYAFSFLFAQAGGHALLFELGAAVLLLALAIDLAAHRSAGASRRAAARDPAGCRRSS